MQVHSPPETSMSFILDSLPDPNVPGEECPRRTKMQIDFLLLALEALDLKASEAMLSTAQELELNGVIPGRVGLWLVRSTNPLRRSNQRRALSLAEAKALVLITCHLARRLTVLIRQLLLGYQQLSDKQLALEHHFRLADYLSRFRAHFRSRMNPRRAAVIAYNSDEKLDALAVELLTQLLLCTGTHGPQRLWSSLFDGEVA
ncbi:DUF3038 domain-containing protein [Sphaerothrix gracilis]|uniref:DUF3038 domain-containing protein n=1 Tax=Sphaerothrix gracilis TaxID=3151835 RepID=UPI0031FC50E2